MAVEAKFRGTCGSCGDRIEPGQMIRFDEGRAVHVDCDGVELEPVRGSNVRPLGGRPVVSPFEHSAPVCDVCWVERPCECGDAA